MKHPGKTRPFLGPDGQVVPNNIAEINHLRLSGLDQWVMIRGENLANSPLILLHGGPGLSKMPFFRHYNAPRENNFTVVYWDQRGAGKSFNPHIPKSSMTVEQFIADLDELVDMVCARVGKSKVTIFGHSWGSTLGPLYAARFPAKVAAYVGSGQIGDWPAGELASYECTLAEAQRRRNAKPLKEMRAIGPPPHTTSHLWTERTWLQRFAGQLKGKDLWNMWRTMLGGPEASVFDLPYILRRFRFTLDVMWAEVSALRLQTLVPSLQVPVFFCFGRRDCWVPPEVSVAYLDGLTAPSKQLVWFEQSGTSPSWMSQLSSIEQWWSWYGQRWPLGSPFRRFVRVWLRHTHTVGTATLSAGYFAKETTMTTKTTRNVLVALLAFLGLGALSGGGVLIVSPSGQLMGMPLSLLAHSPFRSFLVPGLLLFFVLGVAPCLLVVALLKKPASKLAERLNLFDDMHWAWTSSVYLAFALIIWLQVEMMLLNAVSWLHTFYMLLAVAILLVALLPDTRALYKK